MILLKMTKLGIDPDKYKNVEDQSEKFSFVLINPHCDLFLKPGDIVYLLKPGTPVDNPNSNSNNKMTPQKSHALYNIDEESPLESNQLIETFSLPTSMLSINESSEDACRGYKNKCDLTRKRYSLDNLQRNVSLRTFNRFFSTNSKDLLERMNSNQPISELDELKMFDKQNSKHLISSYDHNGNLKSKLTMSNNELSFS